MADGRWDLNGSGNQTVYMNNYRESQTGNQSNFRIIVTYEHNGWGSFTGATQSWSASTSKGNNWSGTFTIPQGVDIGLLNTTYSHGHDADGYLSAFTVSCWIDTNHSSIGDGGGSVTEPAAPRIPKVPDAPTPIGIDNVTSTAFRYRFSGNDNGGSAIIEWQIQYSTSSTFASGNQTVSSTGTSTITGLTAGTTYYVRARGRNSIGWGPYSTTQNTTTLGGPPSPPTNLQATAIPPDQIDFDWGLPVSDGGKSITGYVAQASTVAGFNSDLSQISTVAGVRTALFTGLTPGASYYLRVRADNADEVGEWATVGPVLLPAGGKVWTGSVWKSSLWKVWTGSLWKVALVKVWTGTLWKVSK